MKITEIYTKYKIPKNLQEHQFRVAAVAWQICDSLSVEIEKELIIKACLLHDMGNIVKYDWASMNMKDDHLDSQLDYWKSVQEDFKSRYGTEDHIATFSILKEIGIDEGMIDLATKAQFKLICKHRDNKDLAPKMLFYADARVAPYGILAYEDRMLEANKRYSSHPNKEKHIGQDQWKKYVDCGKDIEEQIFALTNISPEHITDESIESYFEKLKEFEF